MVSIAKTKGAITKRILLLNDSAKRDLLGLRLLERALQRRGFVTAICNPTNAKVRLRGFRPHAFIAARGDYRIAREIASVCRVYIVPGEGAQQTKETILSVFMGRGYWKLDSVDWISRCYLWSDITRQWLLDTGMFRDEQLLVVGNPRLDIYRNRELLTSLRGPGNRPFRLGVAFSAKSTSTYYGHPHFAKVYHDMHREMSFPITAPNRHFEDVVWRDHAILRRMMRYAKRYLESEQGELWFRPSPFESPREYLFLEKTYPGKVRVLPNQTLPEFLCGVDAVLTCWSTVGLEGLLLGVPIISIAGTIDQEHLFRHISAKASGFETFVEYYHRPSSEEALFEMLDRTRSGNLAPSPLPAEAVHRLLNQLYTWPGERAAVELIADDLMWDMETLVEANQEQWRRAVKFRYDLPAFVANLTHPLVSFARLIRSGEFRAYRDFTRTKDAAVEALVRRI